jgi:hypothetical protein
VRSEKPAVSLWAVLQLRRSVASVPRSSPGHVMWDLWWTKWRWGRFSSSTSVSPVSFHSINCSTITTVYHLGLAEQTSMAAVPSGLGLTPLRMTTKNKSQWTESEGNHRALSSDNADQSTTSDPQTHYIILSPAPRPSVFPANLLSVFTVASWMLPRLGCNVAQWSIRRGAHFILQQLAENCTKQIYEHVSSL